MPPRGLVKGSQEMKAYMSNLRSMRKNKMNGQGMVSDLMEKGKKYLVEEGKNQLENLVDMGSNVIKKKIRGKGFFGNLGKNLLNKGLDFLPVPNIVRNAGRSIGNDLIDQTGLGAMVKIKNKRTNNKNKKIMNGNGLMPAGY